MKIENTVFTERLVSKQGLNPATAQMGEWPCSCQKMCH